MANIFPIDFEEKNDIAQDDFILFSDSEDGNKLKKAQYSNLKGEKGDDGEAATITVGSTTTGAAGTSASVVNSGTSSAAVLDFTIPKGADGQDGADGEAATISVGTTSTLPAGSDATVTNSGTSSAAVFNFGIPKGDTGATGNGIASITSSKVGKTTTVTITETDGDVDTFTVEDGADGENPNTKTFTLSSTSDLINAQAAYDYYLAGNNAIIKYDNKFYFYGYSTATNAYWMVANEKVMDQSSYSTYAKDSIQLALSSNTVTAINSINISTNDSGFLRVGKNYGTPYTPTNNGSPATKKYVDDKVSDTAYANTWDGDTTHAPSQNAVYDKISAMDTTISGKQDTLTTQTAYTSQGGDSKVPQITTNSLGQVTGITEVSINYPSQVSDTAYGSSWDGVTATAPSKNAVYDEIETINEVIPSAATSSNQLADKNYVDDSINSITAYYITKNAAGDQFATYAELAAATTFYSGGVVRVPTRNDYCIVQADENHDNATTRYIYQNNQWEYQYTVNETALTTAQLNALNSGITSAKVSTYDGYASTISGKQDALATQTAYTSKGTSTKVATITTNTLGQVTAISETSIGFPVTSVNGNTGAVTVAETEIVYATQTEYNNLPSSKLTDGKHYVIYTSDSPTPPPPTPGTLPAEYQEVEWIGSSGSQRINTGVVASANIGYEANVNFTALSGDWAIMTTDNSWDYRYGVSGYYDDLQIGINKSGEMHVQILDAVSTGVDYVFLYNYNNSGECKLNGNVIVNTIQQSTMPYTLNMNIFTENHSGSYVRYCSCKLYYMKMWDGTTLIRDFVPCYRKLDSVIGLYDLVNNVFYTNNGSGTFTKGPDAN